MYWALSFDITLTCSYMWDLTSWAHIWCVSGFVLKIGCYTNSVTVGIWWCSFPITVGFFKLTLITISTASLLHQTAVYCWANTASSWFQSAVLSRTTLPVHHLSRQLYHCQFRAATSWVDLGNTAGSVLEPTVLCLSSLSVFRWTSCDLIFTFCYLIIYFIIFVWYFIFPMVNYGNVY